MSKTLSGSAVKRTAYFNCLIESCFVMFLRHPDVIPDTPFNFVIRQTLHDKIPAHKRRRRMRVNIDRTAWR